MPGRLPSPNHRKSQQGGTQACLLSLASRTGTSPFFLRILTTQTANKVQQTTTLARPAAATPLKSRGWLQTAEEAQRPNSAALTKVISTPEHSTRWRAGTR